MLIPFFTLAMTAPARQSAFRRSAIAHLLFLSTGIGIVLGVVVLTVALGPAVFVLCYRRYQQVYSQRRDD